MFQAVHSGHLVSSVCADSETVMHVDELDATIQMMLYTDYTYTKVYSSAPTIELRNKVGQRSLTSSTKSESNLCFCSLKELLKKKTCAGVRGGDRHRA